MQRHGGQLLIESLIALGATKSFGVPGESYLAALDALHDTQGQLDFILCRNEGGAAFAAAAWGKLTGSPGICFVTRGPGATNASIGVHTAMQDSAPMLIFVGQAGTDMRDREAFQELNYRAVFGSMAKWVTEIDHVARIPELLARAWSHALSGRPGPVVIALPEDMLSSHTDTAPLAAASEIVPPAPDPVAMARVESALSQAHRPLVLIGGCNWDSTGQSALQSFAEASDIPVVTAFRYQDQFDNFSDVYAGEAGVGMPAHVRSLLEEADVILAINVRFGEMTTGAYEIFDVPQPRQMLLHVHPSDMEIGKIYQPRLGIQAGPNAFARALRPVQGAWQSWTETARTGFLASLQAPDQASPVDMVKVCAYLREVLPDDAIVTNGAGNFAVWPNKFLTYGPKARLLAPQSGAMGYGLPAAIAAKVACPDRTILCFCGDGDFQMTCAELGTAMQAGAQPIVLILNNSSYGTIRAHQEKTYPGRVSGTDLQNPDFVALARAYGFHSEQVTRTEDFAAAFERATASDTGAVLDVTVSAEAITPRTTLSQMRAAALAREGQSR
ncbi:MAG: thiamine pyrophosphate-dependent enzyme [Pseudomonadota bacterium]